MRFKKLTTVCLLTILANPLARGVDLSDYNGRMFNGALVYSDEWANMSVTQAPTGLYRFTMGQNPAIEKKYSRMALDFMSGANCRGKFYGVRPITMFGSLSSVEYDCIDTQSYSLVAQQYIEENVNWEAVDCGMTYDLASGQIYAVEYNDDLTGLYWSTFSTDPMGYNQITKWKSKFSIVALGNTPDGRFYAISTAGDLYEIDRKRGTTALVGSTGVNVQQSTQSLVWDNANGNFLWAACTPSGSGIYAVDAQTGSASLIQALDHGEQIVGAWFEDNTALPKAPAAVTDLKVSYASPGSSSATISATLPSTTFDSAPISGEVYYELWLDGEIAMEGNAAGGSPITYDCSLAEGNHYVYLMVKNSVGFAPAAYVYEFAGNDTPQPPVVTGFEVNDGVASLTWEAPATGVNGGYIDASSQRFNVYRMPGNMLVAENIAETTYSGSLPEDMARYSFKIQTTCGGKSSTFATSDEILFGRSFTVPYTFVFDNPGAATLFTTADIMGNNVNWSYNSWNNELSISCPYGGEADNWLITPRIALKAGTLYRMSVYAQAGSAYAQENFAMAYGTGNTAEDLNSFVNFAEWNKYSTGNSAKDITGDFYVPQDGDYYLCLKYQSNSDKTDGAMPGSMFRMKSMSFEEVGNIKAPSATADLEINPDANYGLSAKLTFTAPENAIDGTALSSLESADIFRDNSETPVGSVSAPAPGSKLEWSDTSVPDTDFHTYTVRFKNSYGYGAEAEATAFIGIYSTPYTENFSDPRHVSLFSYYGENLPEDAEVQFGKNYNGGLEVTYFCMQTPVSLTMTSPAFMLEAGTVYQLDYDLALNDSKEENIYKFMLGTSPTPDGMTVEVADLPRTGYMAAPVSHQFTVEKSGVYYLGWKAVANADYTYISHSITNLNLTLKGSAKAPGEVTDIEATPASDGSLSATITFTTPSVDMAGNDLDEITGINVFRGETATGMPIKTFMSPATGAALSFTDENADKGINKYTIVATNSYGTGNAVPVEVFVGFDIPVSVSMLKITPDATNQKPTLSWIPPHEGINGGIIDSGNLRFNIYSIDPEQPEEKQFSLLGTTSDNSYFVDRTPTDQQEIAYYGVRPLQGETEGVTSISFSILGKPYNMPYTESFPEGAYTTKPWAMVNTGSNDALWGWVSNDAMQTVYPGVYSQDNDGGMAALFNGEEDYALDNTLISPKITLDGKTAQLTLYVYAGLDKAYDTPPVIQAMVTIDEDTFIPLGEPVDLTQGQRGWQKLTYDLSAYKDAPALSLLFYGTLRGYREFIAIDNICVSEVSGIQVINADEKIVVLTNNESVSIFGSEGKSISVYTYQGVEVAHRQGENDCVKINLPAGIYLVKVGNTVQKVII